MTAEEYRRLRQSLGTQKEVAEALGVARNTIARRERGELPIDGEAALAMRCLAEHAPPDPEDTRGGTER